MQNEDTETSNPTTSHQREPLSPSAVNALEEPNPPLPSTPSAPHGQAPSTPTTARARSGAVEALLRQAMNMLEQARPMPLSTSVIINRDDLNSVLTQAFELLPEELQAARWLLKERDDMRARMRREGEDIIAAARARAEQMVQRSEVKKEADRQARRAIETAEGQALRMKLETEDWCDQRLAGLESLLQKSLNAVLAGRQRLQDTRLPNPENEVSEDKPEKKIYDYDYDAD